MDEPKKRRWDGKRARAIAAANGKAVGMAAHRDQSRIKVTDEKRERILELRAELRLTDDRDIPYVRSL